MVGFKSIWLLLTLLLFAACVPQTKQTQCGSNEAFSASLRTCVPIVNGPSSFINIDSFLPTSSLTKYKNDATPITLSIVVSNPYAQTYTIEWERLYNGVPVVISPSTPTTYSFAPSFLATEIGTHIISVRIKDTSNNIVDSHSFEIKINDNPKPVIQSATVTPALYASTYNPGNLPQNFLFTINNNGGVVLGAGYRTDWKLYRAGVLIDSESDAFTNTSTTAFNYPSYAFNPFSIDGVSIGAYVVNARVTNTLGEVVAEQQWSATVTHPSLSKINNRDIYSSVSSPAFSAVTTAYNSVAYTASTPYNFVPVGGVAQGNYCVSVANGEGTYASDGLYVRIDFYLDGGSLIYSGLTTTLDPKICLSDAAAATLNSIVFTNASPTTAQAHTLVARVVDEATGQEYATTDMNGSLGTYPVTWNFNVKPQNAAPTVSFGTMTGVACTTTVGSTKSGCTTASDTNFTVKINLAADDFYTLPANEANFDYSIRLYQDGVNIQTCTKTDPGYTAATDVNGADGYDCIFSIESYDGSGPIPLNSHSYQIQAEIYDLGSPITGATATSSTLTWNFAASGVSETNTAPSLAAWSVSGAVTEGLITPLVFSVNITDAQRDNHTYAIKYCPDGPCLTPTTLTSGTITRTSNTNPYALSVTYYLPEDFLLGLTGLNCHIIKRGQTCAVSFFISVSDVPTTATPLTTVGSTMASTITNFNPAPTLNTAFSNPAPSTFTALTTFAFVGHPMTISNTPASILTDTSVVAAEKTYRYQWFVKNNTSVTTYTAIDGATGVNLVWTPSHIKESNLATDNPLSFMLCAEDQPASAVSSPNLVDSTCSSATPWIVTVRNNVAVAHDLSAAPSSTELATTALDKGTETAIWYDTPSTFNAVTSSAAYIAMIGNDQDIHVKKVLVRDRGGIDTINAAEIISFYPVPSGTVSEIKDLSITGTATELYVAYLASRTGAPGSFYPQVRRIDLTATLGKSIPNNHSGKFGFDYDGLAFTNSCAPAGDCPISAASGVASITFSPTGVSIAGTFILGTPNGNFTFDFGTYDGVDTICSTCSGSTMATNLTDIINTSTNPLLAGYSATVAGGTVTILGATGNALTFDHFDASTDANARIADRMGKIYISGSSWYLPFINTSLGGGYNDKLSVYNASTGGKMSSFAEGILEPAGSPGLASMDAAIKFDNYLVGANLWIAMVSKTGSAGKLYKVDPNSYALVDSDNIFSTEALLDVQVSASTSNVFIGATVAVGSELKLGVYDVNGTLQDEFEMDDLTNVDAASDTEDYFNTSDISSYKIVPYGTEARLFAVSKGLGATYKLYAARLRVVSNIWTLSCGDCKTISEVGQDLSPYVSIGVAPIRDNPSALYRLSSDGSVASQGIKDVAFVSFGQKNTASATTGDPGIGVFNVEGEAVNSTSIYTGVNPNEDAGLYRPPFIKN
jgi:hypothetical protein